MASKLRLLRPRFSLWALLVLITVIAIPLGYVAQRRSWNLRRAATLEALDGTKFNFYTVSVVDPFAEDSPKWLFLDWWDELCQNGISENLVGVSSMSVDGGGKRPVATNEDLWRLRDFPEIQSVTLWDETEITDEGLLVLARLPKLRWLELREISHCTCRCLREFGAASPLEALYLSGVEKLEGVALRKLKHFSQLKALLIDRCPQVTDGSLRDANLPPSLQFLRVWNQGVGDETLGRWLTQAKLEWLDLDVHVTRAVAPALANQDGLRSLRIVNAPLVDEDFAFLSRCDGLYLLELREMPIRGAFLRGIAHPELFEKLDLTATPFADEHLDSLRAFSRLDELILDWTPISGEGFEGKEPWPLIRELSLHGARFSDRGKAIFRELHGPHRVNLPMNWNWSSDDTNQIYENKPLMRQALSRDRTEFVAYPSFGPEGHQMVDQVVGPYHFSLSNCPGEAMASVRRLLELSGSLDAPSGGEGAVK